MHSRSTLILHVSLWVFHCGFYSLSYSSDLEPVLVGALHWLWIPLGQIYISIYVGSSMTVYGDLFHMMSHALKGGNILHHVLLYRLHRNFCSMSGARCTLLLH